MPGRRPGNIGGSTLFAAIEKQLGLNLESRKAPMEAIVIDHVD
jgi:uncharacterized protein (TIGR03435 family)